MPENGADTPLQQCLNKSRLRLTFSEHPASWHVKRLAAHVPEKRYKLLLWKAPETDVSARVFAGATHLSPAEPPPPERAK